MNVIFDMDDILWDFNGRICERIGLDKNNTVTFKVSENPILTDEEKDRLRTAYADETMFENIVWYPAVKRIHELVDKGINVSVNSNCGSEGVIRRKHPQLKDALKLPDDKIRLNLVTVDKHQSKNIGSDIDIFVDDNPHNVAESNAKINLMIKCPWNQSEAMKEIVKDKVVIYLDSLDEVIDFIEQVFAK